MAVNLTQVLNEILYDKEANMKPEDIRYGSVMLGIRGTLRPVTLEGGDTATLIYTQTDTPINYDGLWLNTDKTYEHIYIEPERYTNKYSWMVSDDTTDGNSDVTNIMKGIKAPVTMEGCTYIQRGNILHCFGSRIYNRAESAEPEESSHQHYVYDFDTNTWTRLVNTPTPQAMGGAVWIGDYIYILGSVYSTYYQYCYKYDTINDTYERLPDLVSGSYNSYPVSADLGDENNVYWVRGRQIFKRNLDDHSDTVLSTYSDSTADFRLFTSYKTASSAWYYTQNLFKYIDGQLYIGDASGNVSYYYYFYVYDIKTNTITTKNVSSTNYLAPKLCDGQYIYCRGRINTSSVYQYAAIYNLATGSTTHTNSTNTYSTTMWYRNMPVCLFTAEPYNILCCIGNTTRTTAMTLESKEYTFDDNTLIIYSTSNGTGTYRTKLFENNKILNAEKIYTAFDNVDLFEKGETENTLIKNIPTYYGNGSDWVKIK